MIAVEVKSWDSMKFILNYIYTLKVNDGVHPASRPCFFVLKVCKYMNNHVHRALLENT